MTLYKRYLNGDECRVKFVLEKELCPGAKTVHLVGDFNQWDKQASPMKRLKDGSFSISLSLKAGREYHFRYLIDSIFWETDWHADKNVPTVFGDSENSVVVL
jgi:1,4-alpha-glucan branching enzyme